MSKAKWMMKQYWRVGTIRQMFGVILGMFILGRYYYVFIPGLNTIGILGAFTLAGILVLLFLGIGYLYDAKARMWNEQIQVTTEKNPYTYIPPFRFYMMEYPIFFSLFYAIRSALIKQNIDHKKVDNLINYLDSFFGLKASNIQDIQKSINRSKEFMDEHPFVESKEQSIKTGITHRIKKGFQLWVWRLTWVNNFTGLAQDVLIFGSLYIGILIEVPAPVNGVTPFITMLYGILFLSIPLYFTLIVAGWYYDKRLRLWSPDMIVRAERTPYAYVPDPAMLNRLYPILFTYLKMFLLLAEEWELEVTEVEKIVRYLDDYWDLRPEIEGDMKRARDLRTQLGELFRKEKTERN